MTFEVSRSHSVTRFIVEGPNGVVTHDYTADHKHADLDVGPEDQVSVVYLAANGIAAFAPEVLKQAVVVPTAPPVQEPIQETVQEPIQEPEVDEPEIEEPEATEPEAVEPEAVEPEAAEDE